MIFVATTYSRNKLHYLGECELFLVIIHNIVFVNPQMKTVWNNIQTYTSSTMQYALHKSPELLFKYGGWYIFNWFAQLLWQLHDIFEYYSLDHFTREYINYFYEGFIRLEEVNRTTRSEHMFPRGEKKSLYS